MRAQFAFLRGLQDFEQGDNFRQQRQAFVFGQQVDQIDALDAQLVAAHGPNHFGDAARGHCGVGGQIAYLIVGDDQRQQRQPFGP